MAPVWKETVEELGRTVQGSGVPATVSSLKSSGVPLSRKAPLMSKVMRALPLPQARVSSG
jgi:hypothetical protein